MLIHFSRLSFQKGSINDELERLRGRSLRMPEARVVQMFSGICDAVAVLHSFKPAAIAHRLTDILHKINIKGHLQGHWRPHSLYIIQLMKH